MRDFLEWPGKSADEHGVQHPALYHMLDVAAVAEILLEPFSMPPQRAAALIYLTALHDLGKLSESFRAMIDEGTPQGQRHWQITELYLRQLDQELGHQLGADLDIRFVLYAATAGHHGGPPNLSARDAKRTLHRLPKGRTAMREAAMALAALWPDATLDGLTYADALDLSWWLPGLVSAADWIGSNTTWFPAVPPGPDLPHYLELARGKARIAVRATGYGQARPQDGALFDFDLRPMQSACQSIPLPDGPMLAVIEDETGAGKTEAAFLLAQRMMMAGKGQGLFFALPTMATSDAMFLRARDTVGRLFETPPSVTLSHGRAGLSVPFQQLWSASAMRTEDVTCTEWLADDRRRALLADVGVGTIDQALLAALPTRFNTLRHFGLSSKILIVDEVHEMGDPYIAHVLKTLLALHRGAGGSAILLTATLPLTLRRQLMEVYGAAPCDHAYPSLSIAGHGAQAVTPRSHTRGDVQVDRINQATAIQILKNSAAKGAACVWVRNAVDEAISAVADLRAQGVEASLLHARFALGDRRRIEAKQLNRFGKTGQGRKGRVLVATQVVESSLDLDFDVMVSDLAPMAALIQRAGRLWRHMALRPKAERPVPAPVLYVVSPDPAQVHDDRWLVPDLGAGAFVYPIADQWRTTQHIFDTGICAPQGLRGLIEAVHGAQAIPLPSALDDAALRAHGEAMSQRGLAVQNVIRRDTGYRDGGVAQDDRTYPTRLGIEQLTLVLARRSAAGLIPWIEENDTGWHLSEVTASKKRLERLDLPDQTAPEITPITQHWPEWKRAQTWLCVVGDDGKICDGLYYTSESGLHFSECELISIKTMP